MKSLCIALCLALAAPLPGIAAETLVNLPTPAVPIGERMALLADMDVPVGPWRAGVIRTIPAEGQVSQTAWRLDKVAKSTIEIMNDLRAQLEAQGFEVLYQCRTRSCGGFDFRFGIDVLPEPQMHVDLGDFRFLSARRTTAETAEYVTLMVSRSSGGGFVQLSHVAPVDSASSKAVLSTRSAPGTVAVAGGATLPAAYDPALPVGDAGALSAALETGVSVPLDDLTFETGSTRLGPGPFASLDALAAYLAANPDRKVTLVGHSDTSGGLPENIALSRQRAASVAAALSRDYGIPADRLDAEGVGYLAPRASNGTEDGRNLNRRVEVLVTTLD